MKIHQLEYQDNEYEWKLEPFYFTNNPTLLVGISGAGKTQILRAILGLKNIANGNSLNGVKWNVTFSSLGLDGLAGFLYCWQGEFETKKQSLPTSDRDSDEEFKIIAEKLYKDDILIVDRTPEQILFKGSKTPKLAPNKSVINLLKEEEDIRPAAEEIERITLAQPEKYESEGYVISVSLLRHYENASLSEIQESGLPISIKLSLVYRHFPEIFTKIKNQFIEIFPLIENISMEPPRRDDIPMALADFLRETAFVNFKEKGVNNWIKPPNISSGMLKALIYISELYLCPPGSVILLDEFENSLGVNCIESMTEIILENQDNVQFIITSHHPYIINNIPPQHWKIVTRKGGVVRVKEAEDFGISKSRHKAFIDLINILEDYPEGLEGE